MRSTQRSIAFKEETLMLRRNQSMINKKNLNTLKRDKEPFANKRGQDTRRIGLRAIITR